MTVGRRVEERTGHARGTVNSVVESAGNAARGTSMTGGTRSVMSIAFDAGVTGTGHTA